MAAKTAAATNEALIKRLHDVEKDTPEAAAIMGELWEQNIGLVNYAVHKLSGLDQQEQGFEDMRQQAYFAFYAAALAFEPEEGCKFSSYAVRQIRWELCRYYERGGFTVHIPAYMRRRLRNCEETRLRLEAATGHAVTKEAALKAMGLSPAAISSALAASQKLKTASLDAPHGGDADEGGAALLDIMTDGSNMEEMVMGQEWHRELHVVLLEALQEVPEQTRAAIIRHYFHGVSREKIAGECGVSRQTICDREQKAFQTIRAGQYGPELAEFMPTTRSYERARRCITQDKRAIERLQLADNEMELLAL